jgi:hypothetical protein
MSSTPQNPTLLVTIAQEFYASYCRSSDNKNYQGKQCPKWDDLPPKIKEHWRAVARTCTGMHNGGLLRYVVDR